jgi:kinesin family protein 3/17
MEGLDGNVRGIIPRVAEQIVSHVEKHQRQSDSEGIDFSIHATYLEIYQEQLRDLLAPEVDSSDLRIRMDPLSISGKELYVEGLTEKPLKTANDFTKLIRMGTKNRTTAATNMNQVSSRSHAVLTITIDQTMRKTTPKSEDIPHSSPKKRSKIHLIDLAGSERADSTGAVGNRLKEGSAINLSLSSLGNVINALSSRSSHVPYRDSKLTYLLSDSLGGNSLTLVLACISPLASCYEETISTLRFAERAKKVQNRARVNLDPATLRFFVLT